jgi:hypothetical protein
MTLKGNDYMKSNSENKDAQNYKDSVFPGAFEMDDVKDVQHFEHNPQLKKHMKTDMTTHHHASTHKPRQLPGRHQ